MVFTSFSSSGSYVLSSAFSFPEMSHEQFVGRGNESLVSLSVNNSNPNTSLFRFFSGRCCPLSHGDFCPYKGLPSSSKFLKLGDLPFKKKPNWIAYQMVAMNVLPKFVHWENALSHELRGDREKPDRLSTRDERRPTQRLQNDLAAKAGFRDVSSTFSVWWESLVVSSVVHRGPRQREKT